MTSGNLQINEEYLECLIDTGAHTAFISDDYCQFRNFQRESIKNRRNWVTANGSKIQVDCQTELNVKIDKTEFKAIFIIANELSQELIIGVDILKPNNCIIDFAKNSLSCGDSKITINTIEPQKTSFAHANANIEINPFNQETILVKIDKNNDKVIVGSEGRSRVFEMVTSRQQNDAVPIIIQNPSKFPKKIRKGDIIASISPAEILDEIKDDNIITEISYFHRERTITSRTYQHNKSRVIIKIMETG